MTGQLSHRGGQVYKGLLAGTFALWLGAVSCHAPSPASPEPPEAGVPSAELEFLQRRKGERPCAQELAEDIVDMQRRCSQEHWADCVYAANMYAHGCGVAKAPEVAEGLYQRGCSFGSMVGCTMEAYYTKDFEKQLALLEAPCARGYALACGNLAGVLHTRGREADVPRAVTLYRGACDDFEGFCIGLGRLVIHWKLADRYQEAQAALERGCQAKWHEACQTLAYAYDQGSLGHTDSARALAIYEASCDEGHQPSCDALGHMYVLGRGQEKDEGKGVNRFYALCAEGYGPSCHSMGQAMEQGWWYAPNPTEALAYYQLACSMGCDPGCQRAATLGEKK
jgi:uncharacterized protein